jgi:LPS-assembly protein
MKNKSYYILILFFLICLFNSNVNSNEQFNFDVTEVEILEEGNIYKGLKRGEISTNDGTIINANTFEYNKQTNVLNAKGNVKIEDTIKDYIIFADVITYFRNNEIINTLGNSKGVDKNGQVIIANTFEYNKQTNVLNAKGNVKIEDTIKDYIIFAEDITYFRNEKKIITKGKTQSDIRSKYNIKSKDVSFFEDTQKLSSKNKTIIKDRKSKIYYLDKFSYTIPKEELIGENVIIISDFDKPNNEKVYFSNAIINFKKQTLIGKDTKIEAKKNIFEDENNDPRLYGASSISKNGITTIKKGVFTSCKKTDSCTPWSIQADEIIHNKNEKKLTYKNALLRVYDVPVLYFPKFFHPDPTVKRQSGLLQPQINNSNVLGSSVNIPYYHVISDNKDFTFSPTFFDGDLNMFEGEYRQENKNSSLITDFGITTNFTSSYSTKKKNIAHIFSKFNYDFGLDNFNDSKLDIYLEKMNKDTFLKVFEDNLIKNDIRPKDYNILTSGIDFTLNNDAYSFKTGLISYEHLDKKNSDRYQFILPYYNYSSGIYSNDYGNVNFASDGNNVLQNTNNLRTKIINNLNLNSNDFIAPRLGLKNNFNIFFKNVNTVAKEDTTYKSSPQSELMNIVEMSTSLPSIKKTENNTQLLTPKLSFRFNPGDMKNHYNADRKIDVDNIFSIDRLGLDDSFESGKSLTLGIDYDNQNNLKDTEFGAKLATVYRNSEKNTIPKKTTINKKKSYLFGQLNFKNSNFLDLEYNLATDNKLQKINYHSVELDLSVNNFVTNFNFIEEGDVIGSKHIIENITSYNFNENNSLSFKTRRNKEINLTEYYNIVYEYKNDCLIAGIKFNKSYYEDRDLKPSENLFFSITLIPLTNYEHEIDQNLYDQSFWKRD